MPNNEQQRADGTPEPTCSACCHAPMQVMGSGMTHWYKCEACGCATDAATRCQSCGQMLGPSGWCSLCAVLGKPNIGVRGDVPSRPGSAANGGES